MILPVIPVAAPLLAAALLAALHRILNQRFAFYLAYLATFLSIFASTRLALNSYPNRVVYWFGNWQPRGGIALGISFVVDPLGAGLAIFAGVMVLMALLVSSRYFDTVGSFFQVLVMVFLAAMCGFSLTGDVFNLFVFFELMSAAAFALCGYKSEDAGPLEGALNFAVVNTAGAFLALCGIGLLYGRTGALNMAQAGRALGGHSDGLVIASFIFIVAGFFTKAAIAPFHFWLADAHTVAPTPVCIIFSGVMVELGLYAVARVYWTVYQPSFAPHDSGFRTLFVGMGVFTAVVGSLMCFAQRNLKRLLAFSTIGHMGIMLIGFGLLNLRALEGLGIYLAGHGLIKGALFIYAGTLLHRFGTVDEFELHGRGRPMRFTGFLFAVAGLLLAGLPPAGIFRGSSLIEASATSFGWGITAIDLLVAILTGGAVLRVAAGVFRGWGPAHEEERGGGRQIREHRETTSGHESVPAVMAVPPCLMLAAGVALGVLPRFERAIAYGAEMFQAPSAYWASVLGGHGEALRPLPQPDSSLIVGLAAAAGAVLLAGASSFGTRNHRRGGLRRRLGRMTVPLRLVHSGIAPDYIAWFTVGVAAMGAASAALLR